MSSTIINLLEWNLIWCSISW